MSKRPRMFTPLFLQENQETQSLFTILNEGEEEFQVASEWLESKMPIAPQGRISWEIISDKVCSTWSSPSSLVTTLNSIVIEEKLCGDVFVLWTNTLKKPVKASLTVVLSHLEKIVNEDWDTWICSITNDWCVEVFHDGEICFGRVKGIT